MDHTETARWTIACAVWTATILLAAAGAGQLAWSQETGAASAPAAIDFNIPAQPLDNALTDFAVQAKYKLLYTSEMTQGLSSSGVHGQFIPEEALQKLLSGTGLVYHKTDAQTVTLEKDGTGEGAAAGAGAAAAAGHSAAQKKKPLKVEEVVVRAVRERGGFKPLREEATAEDGYRPETISGVGPFDRRKIEDTPYSVSIVSSDLIENLQISRTDQIFRIHPLTQIWIPQNNNNVQQYTVRGFTNNASGTFWDGLRSYSTLGISLEEIERVEVLTGTSGFLYGGSTFGGGSGGVVNYVLKRPTPEPMANVTVGNYGGSQYYVHGDVGGPIDERGKFGYRVNLFYQDGDTPVEYQHLRRTLASAAFDWHITNRMLLQVDASHQDYDMTGQPATWNIPLGITRPDALPGDKLFGQPWTSNHTETKKGGARYTWDINDVFTLRAAYRYQQDHRSFINATNILQANGTHNQSLLNWAPTTYVDQAAFAFLDSKFKVLGIANKVTTGFSGNTSYDKYPRDNLSLVTLTGLTFDDRFRPRPTFPSTGTQQVWSPYKQSLESFIVGDEITFNEQWSVIAGVNWTTIKARSQFGAGSNYNKSAWTPTGSIIYKPLPWLSTYATYMEGLEQGAIAGPNFNNASEVFPPLLSRSYEVGAKATLGKVLLTTALFHIEKANQFIDSTTAPLPTLRQDGRQVHQGIELTVSGKATEDITLYGGVTVMDTTIKKATDPNLEGKRPPNVASQMAKLYAEYNVPFLRALTFTGGVYWTGDQYADGANTDRLKSFLLGDVGARYELHAFDRPFMLRVNAFNVADTNYWMTGFLLGQPRTVMFSVSAQLW